MASGYSYATVAESLLVKEENFGDQPEVTPLDQLPFQLDDAGRRRQRLRRSLQGSSSVGGVPDDVDDGEDAEGGAADQQDRILLREPWPATGLWGPGDKEAGGRGLRTTTTSRERRRRLITIPDSVDWRTAGRVTPVMDQVGVLLEE